MDTTTPYAIFTHPKVVTSMLLIGIGLALSLMMRFFEGQWYLPVASTALCLSTMLVYIHRLDLQDFRGD